MWLFATIFTNKMLGKTEKQLIMDSPETRELLDTRHRSKTSKTQYTEQRQTKYNAKDEEHISK